jgi:multiple sugar transport system permease protein
MRRLLWVVMFLVAMMFVLPIAMMFLTSFKAEGEVLNPASVIPKQWTTQNYRNVLEWSEEAPFGRWLLNSVFVSSSVTFLVLTFSSMAAFAISRLKVRGGKQFLGLVVFSMMVPGQLFLIPVYFILSKLHWLDTPAALIIPATASGFGVFMLSQFMQAVPSAVEEAALIDGCTPAKVFANVTLPLCSPALATLGVLTFIGSWNDYVSPLVYMDSVRNYYTEYGRTLATSVLASVPLLCVFLVFQRQIVESMASSGLKD